MKVRPRESLIGEPEETNGGAIRSGDWDCRALCELSWFQKQSCRVIRSQQWLDWDKNLGRDRSWAVLGQDSVGHKDEWVKKERGKEKYWFLKI